MPDTHALCNTSAPSLLLMEPDAPCSSESAAYLGQASFLITRAVHPQDLYLMRGLNHFSIALLSDLVGALALRASAQIVRSQWPKARILILGKAPRDFEDHLYDDAVSHTSSQGDLMAKIVKVLEDPWSQRIPGVWFPFGSAPATNQPVPPLQESDQRKSLGTARRSAYRRDIPAAERMRQAVR